MNTRQIIKEVKQGTAEYKVDEISVTDLQNAKYYLEDEKLSIVGEFGIYEDLLHEQITQGIHWITNNNDSLLDVHEHCTVLGNKFEHPHLLEEE